jgi:hypothetical protein
MLEPLGAPGARARLARVGETFDSNGSDSTSVPRVEGYPVTEAVPPRRAEGHGTS